VPETPIPSPSQVSSSTVTNIDTDVDDSPLKKKSTSKARGKGASLWDTGLICYMMAPLGENQEAVKKKGMEPNSV